MAASLRREGAELGRSGLWLLCCRPVQRVGSLVYGPPSIIPQRVRMELAFLNATLIDLDPAGITNRWINYTAHPSQTPGTHTRGAAVPRGKMGSAHGPMVPCLHVFRHFRINMDCIDMMCAERCLRGLITCNVVSPARWRCLQTVGQRLRLESRRCQGAGLTHGLFSWHGRVGELHGHRGVQRRVRQHAGAAGRRQRAGRVGGHPADAVRRAPGVLPLATVYAVGRRDAGVILDCVAANTTNRLELCFLFDYRVTRLLARPQVAALAAI